MSDFDGEPRGRSATGAVVIAVIFLAILGTGVGLVLGSQHKKDDGSNQAGGGASATAAPSATRTGGDTASAKPTGTRTPSTTGSYRPVARDKCPQQTEEAAGSTLSVERFIKTNRSEVWICSGGNRTVYQGHQLGTQFRGATTDTSLFLTSVGFEGDVYIATNGDTRYIVGTQTLRVEKNGELQFSENVVDLYQG